jgi:hypothetical protein
MMDMRTKERKAVLAAGDDVSRLISSSEFGIEPERVS